MRMTHSLAHRYGCNCKIFGRAQVSRLKGEDRGAIAALRIGTYRWDRGVDGGFGGGIENCGIAE